MFTIIKKVLDVSTAWNFTRQISTCSHPLYFRMTPLLYGQPLRKKKKSDPTLTRLREDRKRKKLWKAIKKMLRLAKPLKPLHEVDLPETLIEEREKRLRPRIAQSPESLENRYFIGKQWAHYKRQQHLEDIRTIDTLVYSQQRALDELRNESEELYNKAIEIDNSLIGFEATGPVNTPPIANYDSPDGEYIDISKKW